MPTRFASTLSLLGSLGAAVLLLCLPGAAHGQQSRVLGIGSMYYNASEAFSSDDIAWAHEWSDLSAIYGGIGDANLEMLETYGIIVGTREEWTADDGVTRQVRIAQAAQNKFSDIENVTVPVEGAFRRTFRNPYPTKRLNGRDWTGQFDAQDPVDASIPADAIIYNQVNAWNDIQMERWVYAFANDDYDDLIILEHKFTNTSDAPKEDVYIGLTANTNADAYYPGDLWGNYYGATYQQYAAGDPSADSMRVWYSWDADAPNEAGGNIDTRADPDPLWGNFQEPQVMAYAVLHADASANDESDDPAQPQKAGWSQRELSPDLNVADHGAIYDFLSNGWDRANPSSYAMTVNGQGEQVQQGKYRVLRPNLDLRNFDPATEQEKTVLLSFGPYQLAPGEDVRIVTAFAGGSIPQRLAIDAGRAYQNGYSEQRDVGPLPEGRDVYDMLGNHLVRNGDVYDTEGNLIVRAGQMLTQEQKDAIIEIGEEIAFGVTDRAINVWQNGMVQDGQGSFNIPLAPAAPSLTGTSEIDQVRLEWGDEAANDTEAGPIAGYRVYRNFQRPPSVTRPTDTAFVQIAEVDPGVREYLDTDVIRNEEYYYYVTAVTEDGVESSPFQNRTGTSEVRADQALNAQRPPDEAWQENVVVVPNPYHSQAARKYEGERLNFLNLPPYANIHVYTVAGDLVQTITHTSSTGDEDWQEQETFSTLEIVSGVYVYVVEELDGPEGSATGAQSIGKFVVIK